MSENTPAMSSVLRAFEVIDVLWETGGAGPSAVARQMDIPKSTAHIYLQTLSNTEYVVNDDGTYSLSYQFLGTGSRLKHRNRLYQAAESLLEELAESTGELVTLVIEEDGKSVILHLVRGNNSLDLGMYPGMITPLHSNATGKVLLAFLPSDRTDAIVDNYGLERVTERTITDEATLYNELETIRENGYAIDWDQQVTGMGIVGAPIVVDGELEGAVGVACPTGRLQEDSYQQTLLQKIRETIDSITIKYRYGT